MKPPFAYYGGKSRLAELIAGLMPAHRVYLEPFAGSLAVLFAKTPAVNEIVNDVDGAIVTFFRVLRDQPDELERVCSLTPYAREEFDAANDLAGDDLELARRFWVRVNQSFGKTARSHTGWSITTARTQSPPNSVRSRIGRFAACAERLAQVSIECRDAVDVIQRISTPDTVVYADPPYTSSSRRNGRGKTARDYRHDMGGVEDHERLAEALHQTDATVFLSGYRSDLYDELYGQWDRLDIDVHVGSACTRGVTGARAIECIWSNRPIAAQGVLDIQEATA